MLSDLCDKDSDSVPVKEKECYYTNQKGYYMKSGSNKKGNDFEKSKRKWGTNPVDSVQKDTGKQKLILVLGVY